MTDYIATSTDLTAVADAIREKGGTSAPLEWPQGYIDAVDDLSPAPAASVPSKDVDFYDYDGTRVYSYTASEFAALTEMPANPDHSHDAVPLTAQGWNWSLTDAKAYVADYKMLDIGQTYVPTDGKTHIAISIPNADASRRVMTLVFYQTSSNGVTVDWGDGSATATQSGTGNKTFTHTYAEGEYDLTLNCTAGSYYFSGPVVGTASIGAMLNMCGMIREVRIGNNMTSIGDDAFNNHALLKYVLMPNTLTSLGSRAFRYCYAMQFVIVPASVTTTVSRIFNGIYSASRIVISKMGSSTLATDFMYAASTIMIRAFLPASITRISQYAFSGTYGITVMHVPKNVTQVDDYAFNDCMSVKAYHFYRSTPPTMGGTHVFANIASDCVIYVPRGSLNTYKTASNWATYASHIQEEPA